MTRLLAATSAVSGPGSVVHAGLLAVRAARRFGLAAVADERILPARWPDRRRCLDGGLLAAGCAAALAVPAPDMVIATWLGLLGVGLGTSSRPTTRRS